MGQYKYRSPHAREIIYDPDDPKTVLCEFVEHKFETDSKTLAEKLEALDYEPWTEISEDDVFVLADGTEVAVKDLPEEIVRSILGAPKRLIKKGASALGRGGADSKETSPETFVCAECEREFPSQAALNGHMAKHAKEAKE